jgi:hypothetical protein
MQGKVVGQSLVVMDSFALPVQGTETRVNAGNEAIEYMVQYTQESSKVCDRFSDTLTKSLWKWTGRTARKCDWLVSLSPWVRLLVIGNRCIHADDQPKVPRSVCGRCCVFQ